MDDVTAPENVHRGDFMSFLDWLSKPGSVLRDLMAGNGEGALRQGADFLTGPLRAIVPGDHSDLTLARPGDEVHTSDLLGIDQRAHPWLGLGANLVGDTLTDPLSYLSFGAGSAGAAGHAAEAAGDALGHAAEEGASGVEDAAHAADAAGDAAADAAAAAPAAPAATPPPEPDLTGLRFTLPFTDIGTRQFLAGHQVDPLHWIGRGIDTAFHGPAQWAGQLAQGDGRIADAAAALQEPAAQLGRLYDRGKLLTQATVGALNPAPAIGALLQRAKAMAGTTEQPAQDLVGQLFAGTDEAARRAATQAIENVADLGADAATAGQQRYQPIDQVREQSALGEAQARIAAARVQQSGPVPYIAGTDAVDPSVVHIHPDVTDPQDHAALIVHEMTESALMDHGLPYEHAHRLATQAERSLVEGQGRDWDAYQQSMRDRERSIQGQGITLQTPGVPPTLDARPYAQEGDALGHRADPAERVVEGPDGVRPLGEMPTTGARPLPAEGEPGEGEPGEGEPGEGELGEGAAVAPPADHAATLGFAPIDTTRRRRLSAQERALGAGGVDGPHRDINEFGAEIGADEIDEQVAHGAAGWTRPAMDAGSALAAEDADRAAAAYREATTGPFPALVFQRTGSAPREMVDAVMGIGTHRIRDAADPRYPTLTPALQDAVRVRGRMRVEGPSYPGGPSTFTHTLLPAQMERLRTLRSTTRGELAAQRARAAAAATTGEGTPVAGTGTRSITEQVADWQDRLDYVPGLTDAQRQAAKDLVERYGTLYSNPAWNRGLRDQVLGSGGAFGGAHSPEDYVHRSLGDAVADRAGIPGPPRPPTAKPIMARSIETPEQLAAFLNEAQAENPRFSWRNDLADLTSLHASAMARATGQAALGKGILEDDLGPVANAARDQVLAGQPGRWTSLSDPRARQTVKDIIAAIGEADPASARLLDPAFSGMAPRGAIMSAIAKMNAWFKGPAVYGAVIPKLPSILRNVLGHPAQVASDPTLAALGGGARMVKRLPDMVWYVLNEGLRRVFGSPMAPGQMTKAYDLMDATRSAAGGDRAAWMQGLADAGRGDLAEALQHNVVGQGFVDRDQIMREVTQSGWGRRMMRAVGNFTGMSQHAQDAALNVLDIPAKMFKASEDYARLDNYLFLRSQGVEAERAAASVKHAFYDYDTLTPQNRTLRDIIPFAGFQTQAAKAFAPWISRTPAAGVAMASVYDQQPQGPVPGYLSEQLRVPLGEDAAGNDLYAAGFGMPWEVLNDVPDPLKADGLRGLGEDLRSEVVASSSPALKTAYSVLSGRDPYFDTPYGEYGRMPILGDAGRLGEAYNMLLGTGLIQGLDASLRPIGNLMDERKTMAQRILSDTLPVHLTSVDPLVAAHQQVQATLGNTPGVLEGHPYYRGSDPRVQALMAEEARLERALAERKRAAAPLPRPGAPTTS